MVLTDRLKHYKESIAGSKQGKQNSVCRPSNEMTVLVNQSSFNVICVSILMRFLNIRAVDHLHTVSEKRKSFEVIRFN